MHQNHMASNSTTKVRVSSIIKKKADRRNCSMDGEHCKNDSGVQSSTVNSFLKISKYHCVTT